MLVTVTLVPVIVAGFMASLKVALMTVLLATPVAAAAGTVKLTVGRVASTGGAGRVAKLHVKAAPIAIPVLSCTVPAMVATQVVPAGSAALGVSVAVRVAAS